MSSGSIKELDLPVVMIDGIHFRDRVILVALGIDAKGNKHVLGLREGSTESTRVVRSLLSDLVERGLPSPTLGMPHCRTPVHELQRRNIKRVVLFPKSHSAAEASARAL